MVVIIDVGYSVLNRNLSQSLPFLKRPGPENKLIDLEPKCPIPRRRVWNNSKETIKVPGHKGAKEEKEKYSVLQDPRTATFPNS